MVEEMGVQRKNQTSRFYDTVVLTSDSREMVEARFNYTFTSKKNSHDDHDLNGRDSDSDSDSSVVTSTTNTSSPQPTHPDFPFRFLVNEQDPLQGHGKPQGYKDQADAIMISSVAAMRMQMLAQTTILNTCSNFHRLAEVFYLAGCGMAKNPYFEWLQENNNPDFHMKCGMGI